MGAQEEQGGASTRAGEGSEVGKWDLREEGSRGEWRSRKTEGGAALRQQSAAGLDSVLQKPGHLFLTRPGLGCALSSFVIQQTLAAPLLFAGL